MAEIRWTEESSQWLKDIYEYISADNLEAAEKVISTIFEKAQVLRDHPEIGHIY
jgi:toxin ParE1/3/4